MAPFADAIGQWSKPQITGLDLWIKWKQRRRPSWCNILFCSHILFPSFQRVASCLDIVLWFFKEYIPPNFPEIVIHYICLRWQLSDIPAIYIRVRWAIWRRHFWAFLNYGQIRLLLLNIFSVHADHFYHKFVLPCQGMCSNLSDLSLIFVSVNWFCLFSPLISVFWKILMNK